MWLHAPVSTRNGRESFGYCICVLYLALPNVTTCRGRKSIIDIKNAEKYGVRKDGVRRRDALDESFPTSLEVLIAADGEGKKWNLWECLSDDDKDGALYLRTLDDKLEQLKAKLDEHEELDNRLLPVMHRGGSLSMAISAVVAVELSQRND